MARAPHFRIGTKRSTQPDTWEEYVAKVEAAAKSRRKGGNGLTANLRPGRAKETLWNNPRFEKDRCKAMTGQSRGTERCTHWAMIGSQYCRHHGGYRENPAHPATIRLFNEGAVTLHTLHRELGPEVHRAPAEVRNAVKSEIKAAGVRPHNATILEGIKAHEADDGGQAWRRWRASLAARSQDAGNKSA